MDKVSNYNLIMAGNTNIYAMINVIIQATLQLRENNQDEKSYFRHIYIFHTKESLKELMKSEIKWDNELSNYKISSTSLIHYVNDLEESSHEQFNELVDQLKSIINSMNDAQYYVDLTGGLSTIKSTLAVLSYVLDIEYIYSLEITFSTDRAERFEQSKLFYNEIKKRDIPIKYKKFPPIRSFDDFGKFNHTEILRHKNIINKLISQLSKLIPPEYTYNIQHLKDSLLSGVNYRLIGAATNDIYNFRHSVFSSSSGVEEVANILLGILKNSDIENKTLGQKFSEINLYSNDNPKYFINQEMLNQITSLITSIRNDVVHPKIKNRPDNILEIQSFISSNMSIAFIHFVIKALSIFINENDNEFLRFNIIDENDSMDSIYYFGFDGDSTGDYIEKSLNENFNEEDIIYRSKILYNALNEIKKIILKSTKNKNSILFLQGDNILFKSIYNMNLLKSIQDKYTEITGLNSSIGYGITPKEASIALRLAKSVQGNSIIGVAFPD